VKQPIANLSKWIFGHCCWRLRSETAHCKPIEVDIRALLLEVGMKQPIANLSKWIFGHCCWRLRSETVHRKPIEVDVRALLLEVGMKQPIANPCQVVGATLAVARQIRSQPLQKNKEECSLKVASDGY
jgi:hypothetical protein